MQAAAKQDRKPTRLSMGAFMVDATLDEENTLLALLGVCMELWLTPPDLTEILDVRRSYKEGDEKLGDLVERTVEVLHRYLPDCAAFGQRSEESGINTYVVPDEVKLHRLEHDDRVLLRGGIIPETGDRKVKYWLAQVSGVQALYKRIGAGKGVAGWELVWQYRQPQ
jgi:hypothetical protein